MSKKITTKLLNPVFIMNRKNDFCYIYDLLQKFKARGRGGQNDPVWYEASQINFNLNG